MSHLEPIDTAFLQAPRTQIKRLPDRGECDRQTNYGILDEGIIIFEISK
jgi:hypothetical protein